MITREPVDYPVDATRWLRMQLVVRQGLGEVGRATVLGGRALVGLPTLRQARHQREFLHQMFVAGIGSLPVLTVVAVFIGMILALQIGLELQRYNQEVMIGSAVMISMLREMGPFITGLTLAACVGSGMAAQLGTMTVNDEIAALEIMSIDPVRFLMTPRLFALAIMTPLLSFYTCMMGNLGATVVGMTQLNVPWTQYVSAALDIARVKDLYVGLFKALVYGLVIATVSCHEGFTATQGAVGVGDATRRSVITSFLLILVLGYFVTRLFYY